MNQNIPYEIQKIEQQPIITTNQNHEYDEYESNNFNIMNECLYHGIRFQKYLEKLENIFKERKIIAGKYLKNYHFYQDNCNKGEYVSLLKLLKDNTLEYETFILENNVSLLVSPILNAIETKYISYQLWNELQSKDYKLKHIYSYMKGECMCKNYIPLNFIQAIGLPYERLVLYDKKEFADKLLEDILILMKQYDINLPIVDISRYNKILLENNQTKKILKK